MSKRLLVTLGTLAFIGLVLVVGCKTVVIREEPQPVYYVAPPPPTYVVVPTAPPPMVIEHRPPPPPGAVVIWIDGYYHWNDNRYMWVAGHYERPPHERAVWVAPRYEKTGTNYQYHPGHWADKDQVGAEKGPPPKGGPGGPPPGKGYNK